MIKTESLNVLEKWLKTKIKEIEDFSLLSKNTKMGQYYETGRIQAMQDTLTRIKSIRDSLRRKYNQPEN